MLVHCDHTAESGPLRIQQLLGNKAEDLVKRCVAFHKRVEATNHIVKERPLAICDMQSCEDSNFFSCI